MNGWRRSNHISATGEEISLCCVQNISFFMQFELAGRLFLRRRGKGRFVWGYCRPTLSGASFSWFAFNLLLHYYCHFYMQFLQAVPSQLLPAGP